MLVHDVEHGLLGSVFVEREVHLCAIALEGGLSLFEILVEVFECVLLDQSCSFTHFIGVRIVTFEGCVASLGLHLSANKVGLMDFIGEVARDDVDFLFRLHGL